MFILHLLTVIKQVSANTRFHGTKITNASTTHELLFRIKAPFLLCLFALDCFGIVRISFFLELVHCFPLIVHIIPEYNKLE